MDKFQSWNKRAKKWVLFVDGKFHDNSPEKFEGVPVKKGKPEAPPPEPETPKDEQPTEQPEKKEEQQPAGNSRESIFKNNRFSIF